MLARRINKQSNCGDNRAAHDVEQPLQHINSEHVCRGNFRVARKQEWPNWFAGSSEHENRCKARERHSIDGPEFGFTHVFLEDLPSHRAQSEADVNHADAKEYVERICASNRGPELATAKTANVQKIS